ncbi:hypothetical protein BO70DRAFT_397216 [Aspergillus heteromorphus CBS 117.55]|uniref:BZIP domain-containing protein n=1 Tax=Aspergillus heteromorphus CBS 117.55 TaxID=1448321 RepID=A0A317W2C1_9EURO|nr:uncharacterized protein BO70DRAFT_397216 [Aspergillus heteromorphus CBS 117.55]PWY79741.1 hypothetical protein BO70DRAFT_397216 [Aspergillus heteromorphus CBS 117.55]
MSSQVGAEAILARRRMQNRLAQRKRRQKMNERGKRDPKQLSGASHSPEYGSGTMIEQQHSATANHQDAVEDEYFTMLAMPDLSLSNDDDIGQPQGEAQQVQDITILTSNNLVANQLFNEQQILSGMVDPSSTLGSITEDSGDASGWEAYFSNTEGGKKTPVLEVNHRPELENTSTQLDDGSLVDCSSEDRSNRGETYQ